MATGRLRQAGAVRAMAIIGAAGVVAVLLALVPHVLLAGGSAPPERPAPQRAGQPAPRPSGPGDAAFFPAAASPRPAGSAPAGCAGTCTIPVPYCDEDCQERQLVLYNTNHVLPRPSDVPGITQQQLDERRESIEAKISPLPATYGTEPPYTPDPSPLPPATLPPSPAPAPAAGG